MNFTKEYIKECDCKEVQGLRAELCKGDCMEHKGDKWIIELRDIVWKRNNCIWLPTGDQLDDEIVKIMKAITKKVEDHFYYFSVSFIDGEVSAWEAECGERDTKASFLDDNPLIAKIKLLKALLGDI